MPISIQCPACQRRYNVADTLAGKTVKCRECGESIPVTDPNAPDPDILALEDADESAAPAKGGPSVKRCPSCRTPNPPAAVRCSACGYSLRPAPAVVVEENIPLAAGSAAPKKRKFVRTPDNPTLANIDSLLNLIIWWGSIAALAVWIVHIARSPGGISAQALLPVGVVIALGAVVIAPLMSIAIKVAAHFLQFIPRNDTYNRVLLTLLLPFSASLVSGWPSLNPSLASTILTLAAVASPALFIYLFRSEIMEWGSTVGAGLVGMFLGWFIAVALASIVASATGPLYADMLPPGVWTSLAKGQSPPPVAPKVDVAAAPAPTTATASTSPSPDEPLIAAAPAGPAAATPAAPGSVRADLVPNRPTARHETPSLFPPATPATPDAAATPAPQTNFFADVQADEQNLLDIREAIPTTAPFPWFLVVKGSDAGGPVTVERWSVQPLAKKGSQSFSELPQQPNAYALSPHGDTLVAVVHFPRNQLEISNFESKAPPRVVPFPVERLNAVPSLTGFLDLSHYGVRWTFGGITNFQIWNTTASSSHMIAPEMEPGPNNIAFSPDGRWLATIGRGPMGVQQIILYNVGTGVVARRISPTSELFKSTGLAFSPDSTQIALCAVLSNVTTVLTFKVQNGLPVLSQMLGTADATPSNATAHPANGAATTPGLLWLQNGLAWLINGNDLYETTAGKNIGSLNLPDVLDLQLAGANSVLILQKTADNTKRLVVAKWDDAALKSAIDKVK
jgi:predicted Zn finger-like uncharacterized protein